MYSVSGEFMWFITEFLISKPKLCLHHNGTRHFTLLLQAFFPTVLPHRAGPEQSRNPFSQEHSGNTLCFYKTLLSHTHRGHWWAPSTSVDSVAKSTEVTVTVLTRAAKPGRECRSLPIHMGWGRGNSTSDQISSSSAKQPTDKTFALSYQLRFLHRVPQFHGHAFIQV